MRYVTIYLINTEYNYDETRDADKSVAVEASALYRRDRDFLPTRGNFRPVMTAAENGPQSTPSANIIEPGYDVTRLDPLRHGI